MFKSRIQLSISESFAKSPKILPGKCAAAFVISQGKVERVSKTVRETTEALLGYDPEGAVLSGKSRSEGIPECAEIDEDAVWNGMVAEIAKKGPVLPKSLESLKEAVEGIRGETVTVLSDQKYSKWKKPDRKSLSGAEKEAKRAEERQRRKLERETVSDERKSNPKSSPTYGIVSKKIAKNPVAMKVYEYFTEPDSNARPEDFEAKIFIDEIDRLLLELTMARGIKRGHPVLQELTFYRVEALIRFPEIEDPFRQAILNAA
ncbi:MAG: hypothetical protein QG650_69 [Patescibacteria group bacterium]|nr:hypothetical protein [Patescibacteria group bacterium]